jgi:hypothetical protein
MSAPIIVWLWPEQDRIRAWTPAQTRLFSTLSPGPEPLSHRSLRDGLETIDLRRALHPELADFLNTALATGQPPHLRLAYGLPKAWRDFPYEQLEHAGQPLAGRIAVARDVPFPSEADTALPNPQAAVFDLWLRTEPVKPTEGLRQHWPCLEILNTEKLANRFMVSRNLHDYGLLIVVTHGSEGHLDAPFRLADGREWSLPMGRGMPALVILLACGDEDGNLLAYGRELLEAGAHTVLAPKGKLDARGAAIFLDSFLRDWLNHGLNAAEALRRAQINDQREGYGAQRLYLLGEAGLRWGATDAPDYTGTEELEVRARRELQDTTPPIALPALCERLTLQHYQRDGTLDDLKHPFKKPEEAVLLQRLYPLADSLSSLTQSWVLPLLAYLAEIHDHRLLQPLENLRPHLEQKQPDGLPPTGYHHWAKLYYRRGKYICAARELATGLTRVAPDQRLQQSAGLLGTLLNVLIDQALVEPALRTEQRLDLYLAQRTDENVEEIQRKFVDRRARLALRAGEGERAHILYRRRWYSDKQDERALPWLLYIAAWYPMAEAREYRDAGLAQLVLAKLTPDLVGDDDALYRLRALAAWAWRHDDTEVAEAIAPAIVFCTERLLDHPDLDAGPPGFTLAYLDLYARQHAPTWKDRLPSWGYVAEALREHRYFLELAAFAALRDETDEARRALEIYQKQRRLVVQELRRLPADLDLPDWDTVLTRREQRENTSLLGTHPITAEVLLKQGLLPL